MPRCQPQGRLLGARCDLALTAALIVAVGEPLVGGQRGGARSGGAQGGAGGKAAEEGRLA